MKVLLIGGTGVLSSAVTDLAKARGIDVTMINRGRRRIPDGVELIISDNRDIDKIKSALKKRKFDAVIDFLCYTPEQLKSSFSLYSNYTEQYFFISSCAVYNTSNNGIFSEDAEKITPSWPYSIDKWNCELLLRDLAKDSGCHYTVIRPCLTYGDTRLPYGIAPEFRKHWTLIARILNGKPIIRWNRGENKWNIMRVEEFAVGVVGLIGRKDAYDEAYNICGDETPSYAEVLEAIGASVGTTVLTIDLDTKFYAEQMENPYLAGEIIGGRGANLICSNEKIKKAVPEFKQTIGLKEGVRKTVDAYRNNNFQLGIDWVFDAQTDRIIEKWSKLKNSSINFNLHFIDYLGTANLSDKLTYWQNRYNGSFSGVLVSKFIGVIRKTMNLVYKKSL